MTDRSEELRRLTALAVAGVAGIVPHALGSGRDGNGELLPHPDQTIADSLDRLVEAGELARTIREVGSL